MERWCSGQRKREWNDSQSQEPQEQRLAVSVLALGTPGRGRHIERPPALVKQVREHNS